MKLALALLLTLSAAAQPAPKNIIFVIGDGTGPAHYTAMRHLRGAEFRTGTMPVVGLATTPSVDRYVTDSAAAATALATGVKVNHAAVSMAPDGTSPTTVLEAAEKLGKATGLVTTAKFFDATPAAFASHAKDRDEWVNIINQMARSGAELIVGGGRAAFGKEDMPALDAYAKESGYAVFTDWASLSTATGTRILGVFPEQPRNMDFPDVPLATLAQWAIDRLRNDPQGFFLMIEHEGTDSASHQNFTSDVAASLRSLDAAVGVALDFARAAGNTLVIVTGDHETGGMRITESKAGRFRVEFVTTDHTAVAVPVFAFGPGSAAFAGFYENTHIGKTLLAVLGVRQP